MKRFWKRSLLVVLLGALVATACGSTSTRVDSAGESVDVSERSDPTADPRLAGEAITAFGLDMFGASRAEGAAENLTLSPASIAIALAMLEPGAGDGTTDDVQAQFRDVLHFDDSAAFHASMNALEQALESRVPGDYGDDSDPGELTLRIANAAYLQEGFPFLPEYLDVIGSNYGSVLNEVDFSTDPDAVAHEINDWVADHTEDRITDLIGDGVIEPATVLALVNALYMNASWFEPFEPSRTVDEAFTLLDGSTVEVPLMQGFGDSSSRGDGWVGATKAYTGNLSIEFILPDEGRFEEIADNLDSVFASYRDRASGGTTLHVPRFETRTSLELSPPLKALGLTLPYVEGNLLGLADSGDLVVDKVIHETFVAIDEEGTEAAAATVVLVSETSAPGFVIEPVPVILDRPFVYRIMDRETGTTLFIGQVLDPTAGA